MIKVKEVYKKIFFGIIVAMLILGLVAPLALFAAEGDNPPNSGGNNPPSSGGTNISFEFKNPLKGGVDNIPDFLKMVIQDIVMPIGAVVAVLMIIYAGFLYVTAAGDTSKIKRAHDALLYGVIGATILLGAWVIAKAIQGTINQLQG